MSFQNSTKGRRKAVTHPQQSVFAPPFGLFPLPESKKRIVERMNFLETLDFEPPPLAEPVSEAALFRTLWSSPSQAVAILSDLGMAEANDRFQKFVAPDRLEDLGEAVLGLFSGESIQLLKKVWAAELHGFEFEAVTRRGRNLRLNVLAEGRRALVLATDISDLSAMHDELESKFEELEVKNAALKQYIDGNLQLENFAFLASHDLREPIRTIGSFSQLLQKRHSEKLDDAGREFLRFIRSAVSTMDQLTDDLLHFSQISSQEMFFEAVSINKCIETEQKRLTEFFPDLDFSIKMDGATQATTIIGDRKMIANLLFHLFHNGLKFRKSDVPPVLRVAFFEEKNAWHFSVTDNGIGIDAAFFDKIFVLLKRLHLRHEFAGSGIGLSVCRKIVERHGGSIWVESQVGEGSAFHFLIQKSTKKD